MGQLIDSWWTILLVLLVKYFALDLLLEPGAEPVDPLIAAADNLKFDVLDLWTNLDFSCDPHNKCAGA